MSSFTRRMQRQRNGLGAKLGATNDEAKDLVARQRRERSRKESAK